MELALSRKSSRWTRAVACTARRATTPLRAWSNYDRRTHRPLHTRGPGRRLGANSRAHDGVPRVPREHGVDGPQRVRPGSHPRGGGGLWNRGRALSGGAGVVRAVAARVGRNVRRFRPAPVSYTHLT